MQFRGYMLLVVGLVFGGALFSQAQKDREPKTPVDISAKEANRYPELEENAIVLTGEVVFHHNGAVISCDSAVRYSDRRIDCFKNVIINKDSIYVYGDRAEYNGDRNLARVYSPVVKVVDGSATLYTYHFTFNTFDNIGTYYGGGVMYQEGNIMESEKGYYYSDLREMVAVKNVELKNEEYMMRGDSVRYNMDTKVAHFYTKSYIWTTEGEILTADRGHYNTADSTYFFHGNSYVLTDFRETWADTIDYRGREQDALLYGNIQINDEENSSSAFGDFGQYWGERGETVLTRRPSIFNYDKERNNSDTLYMRADTIFMYIIYPSDRPRKDAFAELDIDNYAHLRWVDSLPDSVRLGMADSLAGVILRLRSESDSLRRTADGIMGVLYPPEIPGLPDTVSDIDRVMELLPDSLGGLTPSSLLEMFDGGQMPENLSHLASDSIDVAALRNVMESSPEQEQEPEKQIPPEVQAMRLRIEQLTFEADSLRTAEAYIRPKPENAPAEGLSPPDSLSRADSLVISDSLAHLDKKALKKHLKTEKKRLNAEKKAEEQRLKTEKRAAKAAARAEKAAQKAALKAAQKAEKDAERRRKLIERGRILVDNLRTDTLPLTDTLALVDSLALSDSLARLDSLETITPEEPASEADTTERIVRGWYDVKIWRTDMQAVCDSIVSFSRDSTVHMYTDPVLWNGESQIVCDSLTLFIDGENVDRGEFYGSPIMSSRLQTGQFNQATGRTMTSWFRDNAVYRHDIFGNAEAYYYVQEDDDPAPVVFIVATSSNMSFILENDSLRYIIARENVEWPLYPIEQIPADQPVELKGFKWFDYRKPTLADVFDRQIRPTEREHHESLEQPAFPIAAKIARRREYLIENRLWADRVDPLPAHAVEFVNSLEP